MATVVKTSTPGIWKVTYDDEQTIRYRLIIDAGPGPDPKTGEHKERRQVCRTLRTFKEARAEKSRIEQARESQETVFLPDRKLTIARALDEWLAGCVDIDEQCRYNYASTVRMLKARWPSHRASALSVPMVRELINDMQSGRARRIGEGPMSPRTIRVVVSVLAMAYDELVRQQQVPVNPVRWAKLPKVPKRVDRAWSADETTAFLHAAADEEPDLYAGFLLSAFGMRPSEVLALTWADVDLYAGTLTVVKSKTSAGVRDLPLPPLLVNALKAQRKRQTEARLASPVPWAYPQQTGYVVCDEIGRPVPIKRYRATFKELAVAADLRPIRLYDLRHGAATLFAALGVYPEVRARWLGHSNSSITLAQYTDTASAEQLRDAGQRLAALLAPPT